MKGRGKEWTIALTGDAMNEYVRERFPKQTVEVSVSKVEVSMSNVSNVSNKQEVPMSNYDNKVSGVPSKNGVKAHCVNFSVGDGWIDYRTTNCWFIAGDEFIPISNVTTIKDAEAVAAEYGLPLYLLGDVFEDGAEWIKIVDIKFMVDPNEFFTKDGIAWSLTNEEPCRSKSLQPEQLKKYAKVNIDHIGRCPDGVELTRQYETCGLMDFIGLCEWSIEIAATLGPVIPDALTKDGDWICDFWNKQNLLRHNGFVSKWRMVDGVPQNGGY